MKKNLLFTAAIAIALFFAACGGGGASDATKKSVAAFDSSMGVMQTQVMAFGDSVKAAMAMCEQGCSMESCKETCCEHMTAKCTEMMAPCKSVMEEYNAIIAEMMSAKPHIDSVGAEFSAFKEKVNKGEINDADATKTLAEFTTKMADGGTMFAGWMTKLATAKATCSKTMSTCMEACKTMKCEDKKCAEEMKKKAKA